MQTFQELKKNLKKDFSAYPTVRVALLGDSALQFLGMAIRGYGYELGLNIDLWEAPFGQLHVSEELLAFQAAFVMVVPSSQKLLQDFYQTDNRIDFAERYLQQIDFFYQQVHAQSNSRLIYCNFPALDDGVFGNYANKTQSSFLYQLRSINLGLMDLAQQQANLFISDLSLLQSRLGVETWFDSKFYVSANMVFSLKALPRIAKQILDIVPPIRGQFKKCLILDLDNTLWGGVIGDDGVERIQIGDLGIGKVFTAIQQWAKSLKNRGIILAVCSKNTEHIAKAAFENHPEMVLQLEDFAIFVANWNNKADNIRYIQSVLNIGFDSMVFIDDNPAERAMVQQHLPAVCVPELPKSPAQYLPFLQQQNLFETAAITEKDALRTAQYRTEAQRKIAQASFVDEAAFLKSLKMKGTVKAFDAFSIPRVAQLTQRSNQFNLRTVRYTESDIQAICEADNYVGFAFYLADKFGKHGLISVLLLEKREQGLFIDTWIMSCRVLKRGMEFFVLEQLLNYARQHGFLRLVGEYLPTIKNALVKNHYKDLGFVEKGNVWVLEVANVVVQKHFIEKIG